MMAVLFSSKKLVVNLATVGQGILDHNKILNLVPRGAKAAITEVRGGKTKVVIKQCRMMRMYDIVGTFLKLQLLSVNVYGARGTCIL